MKMTVWFVFIRMLLVLTKCVSEVSKVSFSVKISGRNCEKDIYPGDVISREVPIVISLSEQHIALVAINFCLRNEIGPVECLEEVFVKAVQKLYYEQIERKYEQTMTWQDYVVQHRLFNSIFDAQTVTKTLMPNLPGLQPTETTDSMKAHEVRVLSIINGLMNGSMLNENKNKNPRICFIHSTTIEFQLIDVLHSLLEQITTHGLVDDLQHVFVLNYGLEIPFEIQSQYTSLFNHIHFFQVTSDITWSEAPTLRILHQFNTQLKRNNSEKYLGMQILYMHTKGVTYILPYPNLYDWNAMLLYFMVERHKSCEHLLNSGLYDVIGVNYINSNTTVVPIHGETYSQPQVYTYLFYPNHFAGNFWWATGRYLASIPPLEYNTDMHANKFNCEFWLLDPFMTKHYDSGIINLKSYELHESVTAADGTVYKACKPPRIYSPHRSNINHYYTPYHREKYFRKT